MKKFIIINKKKVFISRKKYNLLKTIDNRYYYTKKLDQKNNIFLVMIQKALMQLIKLEILGLYQANFMKQKKFIMHYIRL